MALQASGTISLQNLATEFGGTAPHALNEYYRSGGLVPNAPQNASIPTSGPLSLNQFYGGANRIQANLTISANTSDYTLNTAKVAGYVAGVMDVTLTINAGVTVWGSSIGALGLDVDTSWHASDSITIINNGTIAGKGGAGGKGGGGTATGTAGSPGGPALRAQRSVTVVNNGTIGGGGGGGGGGATRWTSSTDKGTTYYYYIAGGGGGGGAGGLVAVTGGAAGASTGLTPTVASQNGASGNATTGGNGGAGATATGGVAGTGGAGGKGGNLGVAGASGGNGSGQSIQGPWGGGAAGAAVMGNGNITWGATGTRLGAIT